MKKEHLLLIAVILSIKLVATGQSIVTSVATKLDSLKLEYRGAHVDSLKVKILNQIISTYSRLNTDSGRQAYGSWQE